MSSLKSTYFAELRKSRALVKKIYGGKKSILDLPNALQHFLIQSGFTAYPKLHSVEIHWRNTFLKFSANADWKPITCSQYNFLPDPIRLVYMKAKLMGIFNIEAMDSFRHGEGHMRISALGLFHIADSKGGEMNRSELVTILAETMIIPDYALHSYMRWEEIDHYTLRGTIDYFGLNASGIFYFNDNFEMIRFETNDRYQAKKGNGFKQTKWTAEASNYIKKNGIKFPTAFTATWNQDANDYCYFRGEVAAITLKE